MQLDPVGWGVLALITLPGLIVPDICVKIVPVLGCLAKLVTHDTTLGFSVLWSQ